MDIGMVRAYLERLPVYDHGVSSVARTARLASALNLTPRAIHTLFIAGTHHQSTTVDGVLRFLHEESIAAACIYATQISAWSDRLVAGKEVCTQKVFVAIMSRVLAAAHLLAEPYTSYELMLCAGLMYAAEKKASVIVLEVAGGGAGDAATLFQPLVIGVPRVVGDVGCVTSLVVPGYFFVTADASRNQVLRMKQEILMRGGLWISSVSALAPLPHPVEQLYGRMVSLAASVVRVYVERVLHKPLCVAQRPAVYWQRHGGAFRGGIRFFPQKTPQVLLGVATDLEMMEHFFLGVRLFHYQHTFTQCALIVAVSQEIDGEMLVSALRYVLKTVPGFAILIPSLPDASTVVFSASLVERTARMVMIVYGADSLSQALERARQLVDAQGGLIAIAGATALVQEYLARKDT